MPLVVIISGNIAKFKLKKFVEWNLWKRKHKMHFCWMLDKQNVIP